MRIGRMLVVDEGEPTEKSAEDFEGENAGQHANPHGVGCSPLSPKTTKESHEGEEKDEYQCATDQQKSSPNSIDEE